MALHAEGRPYRVVGRSGSSLQRAFGNDPLAEIHLWNPDLAASIVDAAADVDTIVYLVGVDYDRFDLHPKLMSKTIAGAVEAGVRRILLIATVYPYGIPQSARVTEDHPRSPHTFRGKMRKEQEDILFEAQAAGSIEACSIRLPDFYGPEVDKSFLWSALQAARKGSTAQLVGPIDRPHQYVYVPDVGPLVARFLREEAVWGQSWNFAGSGTITTKQFVEKVFAAAARQPKYFVVNKFMLQMLGLFNPLMRGLAEMNYLMSDPVLLNDDRLIGVLGTVQRTTYDEGIRATLAAMDARS
jgi:nucleoside-diphosphate-sugar epimerase